MTHCNLTLSPGCFLTAEHTHEAAVKAPSQSALIDYTHAIKIQILQRKSNCHIIYSNTTKKVCLYCNITRYQLHIACDAALYRCNFTITRYQLHITRDAALYRFNFTITRYQLHITCDAVLYRFKRHHHKIPASHYLL